MTLVAVPLLVPGAGLLSLVSVTTEITVKTRTAMMAVCTRGCHGALVSRQLEDLQDHGGLTDSPSSSLPLCLFNLGLEVANRDGEFVVQFLTKTEAQ